MKLGVFYHHVKAAAQQLSIPVTDMFDRVRSLGIEWLELDRGALTDFGSDPDSLYRAMNAHGLRGANLWWYYPWETEPEQLYDYQMIEAARALRLDRVMPIPGLYTGTDRSPAELANMIRNMNLLNEKAREAGLRLCIEDYDSELSAISTTAGMEYFARQIPGLRYVFDTGNFFFANEDALAALERLRNGVDHVHVKDRSLRPTSGAGKACLDGTLMYPCAVGQGVIPVKEIVTRLAATGYDGVYAMEFYGVPDYAAAMEESSAYMLNCANELGA